MTSTNTQTNTVITITGKGGVGKSTVTQALATALAAQGHAVTVVEMDEQGSISRRLGITAPATVSDVLLGKVAPAAAAMPTPCGFALIAADDTLEDAVKELDRPGARAAVMTLRNQLRTVAGIILIDTLPQQADFCTESALVAANLVVGVAGPDPDEIGKVDAIKGTVEALGALGVAWGGIVANKGVSTAPGSRGPRTQREQTAAIEARPDYLATIARRVGVDAKADITAQVASKLAPAVLSKIESK